MKIERKDDLSLRLLEIFGAVLTARTTIGAAEALGISQPAVSNAIAKLEAQTGLTLFERSSRGLTPTEEAHLLREEVEPLFSLLGSIESSVRKLKSTQKGSLRILATPPLGHTVLPVTLKEFLTERPETRVRYDIRRLTRVVDGVRTGMAEVGFMLGMVDEDQLHVVHLCDEPLCCVVPANHSLTDATTITAQDLKGEKLIGVDSNIGALIRAAFVRAHVPYYPEMEVRYCHTACVLANAGVGIAIVDGFSARFIGGMDVRVVPFHPTTHIPAVALHRRGVPLSTLATRFVHDLKKRMQAP